MIFKVLILATVFSTGTSSTARKNEEDGGGGAQLRIINGDRAPNDAYPWFAKGNGCGAALVSPEFVITASHCDEYRFDRVRIGAVCTGNANEDYGNCGSDFEVRYSKNMFEPDNSGDLRLIQLTERSTITPAEIDRGLSNSYVGGRANLWTLGFGQTETSSSSDFLLHVESKYVSLADCKKAFEGEDWIDIESSMICGQNDDVSKQACFGDSGGPLYDSVNKTLVGVVSTGNDSCFGLPVIYTRLASYYDWIEETICEHHSAPKPDICNGPPPPLLDNSPEQQDRADPNHKYFQIKSQYDDPQGYLWCLSTSSTTNIVEVDICDITNFRQLWRTNTAGQLRAMNDGGMCMENFQGQKNFRMTACPDDARCVLIFDMLSGSLLWIKNMSDVSQWGLRSIAIMNFPDRNDPSSQRVFVRKRKDKPLQKWDLVYQGNEVDN